MSASRRTYWHSDAIDKGYPVDSANEVRTRVGASDPDANLVSSLLEDGRHCPAVDLDLPAQLIPSTTPGHFHLLIDKPMSWRQYRRLLRAMMRGGLIEPNYYKHCVNRRMSMLRLPHVKKGIPFGRTTRRSEQSRSPG